MRKTVLVLLGAAAGAGLTALVAQPPSWIGTSASAAAAGDTYRQLNLFGDIFERVRSHYVEKPDETKLVEGAINGMLNGLDPHSSYLDPKNLDDMRKIVVEGKFGGLGLEVTMEDGLVKVVAPIDDTPAAKAGIRAGDIITHLNGEAVQGLTLNQAVEKMRGDPNTKLDLWVMRKGADKPLEISIVRDIIRVRSVRSKVEDDVGVIRITQFTEQTTDGLKKAIKDITDQVPADKLKGFVARPAQQPGRSARPGNLGVGCVPGARRDRLHAWPRCGGDATLQRTARRPRQRQAGDRADQRRLGLGLGDRRRRPAGPQARNARGHALVRQGFGADDHPARARAMARCG